MPSAKHPNPEKFSMESSLPFHQFARHALVIQQRLAFGFPFFEQCGHPASARRRRFPFGFVSLRDFSSSAEMMNRLRPLCAPSMARKIFNGTFTLTNFVEVIPQVGFLSIQLQRKGAKMRRRETFNTKFQQDFPFATLRLGVFAINPFPFRHLTLTSLSLCLARFRLTWQHGEPDFARG
jgi:hypothetical protein